MEFEKQDVSMTMDEMADVFINILFAGHDTTAHTIARALAELPRHPDVWDNLVKEQAAVRSLQDCCTCQVHDAACQRHNSSHASLLQKRARRQSSRMEGMQSRS